MSRGGAEALRKDDKKLKVKGGCSREGAKARREGKGFQRQRLARAEARRKEETIGNWRSKAVALAKTRRR